MSCPRGRRPAQRSTQQGTNRTGCFGGGDERGQVATAWVAAQKLRAIFRCGERDHAAARLQSLIETRDASRDIAELRFQLGKIGEAVKSTVPQEMWAAIVEKLEEAEQHPEALDVGEDAFYDADDDPYDPTEFIDEDDEF